MIKVWYNLCTPRCGFIKSFGKGDECEIVETESGEGEWEWRGCLRVETEWEWLGEWERCESGEVLRESERLREAWESSLGESERVSESGETLFLKKPYTKSSLRDLVSRWESTRISHSLVLCFTCPFQIFWPMVGLQRQHRLVNEARLHMVNLSSICNSHTTQEW